MAAHNSSCASPITSRVITSSNSCRDLPLSGSSIIPNHQASGTPTSPRHSVSLEGFQSSTSVYSLTSAPTSDCESPPETPASGRSILNLGRIPDLIPESDFHNKADLERLFALSHHHGSRKLEDSRNSTALIFSPRRWRKRFMEARQSISNGNEQSPEAPTDTRITFETSSMATHVLRDTNPRPWSIPHGTRSLESRDLGVVLPRVSLSPTSELPDSNQATPTQETIDHSTDNSAISPRTSKRARCPPPLDLKSISSYSVFMSEARRNDTSEMKDKKRGTTELGLGLPSITRGQKPARMQDDNEAHSLDVVGSLHPISRPCLPRWRPASLRLLEVAPGPASAPPILQSPPKPRLRPIGPVEFLDHTPSPLELPSPPICAANSWKAKYAPGCQLYFDHISRSSSARTHRSLSAMAPTSTAISSRPSSHTRLVVPPSYRRASSYLKEAIASLPRSALHSPIPPTLVGTSYLESVSSPFSPHFQPHKVNRRATSELLCQDVSVDVLEVDEPWIDVNVPLLRSLPQCIGSSSITPRQSPGGSVGKGPSGRRKKPMRRGAKIPCNPYFADAEHTHSTPRTVLKGSRGLEVVADSKRGHGRC